MAEKPGGRTTDKKPGSQDADPDAGQLGVDERGNVTWQWKDSGDLLADDAVGTAERMSALLDTTLTLSEDEEFPADPGAASAPERGKGYNPYELDGTTGKSSRAKKKNLKQLSEWIELRKKVSGDKKDE